MGDRLAAGARSSDELAAETGTDVDALYRLLRALAAAGVLHELDGRRFELTELGEGLRGDVPASVHGWALMIGRPMHWNTWSSLVDSIHTGENTFRLVHGTDVWSYRAERPEELAIFDNAMTSMTGLADAAVLDAYDFGRFGEVVDVAGGRGALLAAILARHETMSGVLLDQPDVVARAAALLDRFGDRCRVVGGSFFDAVPEGADAYLLKSILHDWEDAECVSILRLIREAMPEHGAVLVLERDLGDPNENPSAKLSDLNMLVNPGGRERSEEEYAALFAAAGLRYVGSTPSSAGVSVFEGCRSVTSDLPPAAGRDDRSFEKGVRMNPNKALWEKGDFTRIAESMRESGEGLVNSLGITKGLEVLDLGCGDGTTALPAARLGADVLGVDIASNLVAAGNARAQSEGLANCRFQEGDATDLRELEDGSFDLVISIFGAMFAPKPLDVAKEMVRVTRPGGRIVMGNWIPNDPTLVAQILRISSSYSPPPPEGFVSPMTWGIEGEVTKRFVSAGAVEDAISFRKDTYTFNAPGPPSDLVAAFRAYYGPTMNAFEAAEANGRAGDLEHELETLFDEQNASASADTTSIPATFLRVSVGV